MKKKLDAEPPKHVARMVYSLDVFIQRIDKDGNSNHEQFSHLFDGDSSISNRIQAISKFISYRDIFNEAIRAGVENFSYGDEAEDNDNLPFSWYCIDLLLITPDGEPWWMFVSLDNKTEILTDLEEEYELYLKYGFEIRDTMNNCGL
jgi:hypothetical protein